MVDDDFALDEDFAEEPNRIEHGRRNFFAGLAVGALLGAGVALLFAPDRGANTRRRLGRQLLRWKDKGGDSVADLKDRFSREIRRLRKKVG